MRNEIRGLVTYPFNHIELKGSAGWFAVVVLRPVTNRSRSNVGIVDKSGRTMVKVGYTIGTLVEGMAAVRVRVVFIDIPWLGAFHSARTAWLFWCRFLRLGFRIFVGFRGLRVLRFWLWLFWFRLGVLVGFRGLRVLWFWSRLLWLGCWIFVGFRGLRVLRFWLWLFWFRLRVFFGFGGLRVLRFWLWVFWFRLGVLIGFRGLRMLRLFWLGCWIFVGFRRLGVFWLWVLVRLRGLREFRFGFWHFRLWFWVFLRIRVRVLF